jgi:hypothetical protein
MRQIANETDGVRENDISCLAKPKLARGRIERRKQLVRRISIRMRQRIKKGSVREICG